MGKYKIRSGNPDDGGYSWYLLDNQQFMMVTFGQVISGKWEVDSKKQIKFTPNRKDSPYEVFGRYNPELKGTKVMFQEFDINENAFLGTDSDEVQAVLSEDANCLPYPLLKEFNKIQKLTLASFMDDEQKILKGLTFDLGKHNDVIIAYYRSSQRIPPFEGRIVKNKLQLSFGGESSAKREIDPEELQELLDVQKELDKHSNANELLANKEYNFVQFTKEENYQPKDFPISTVIFSSNYDFDSSTQTYISKYQQEVNEEDQYHDLNKLYRFQKIEAKPSQIQPKIKKGSLFNITCE